MVNLTKKLITRLFSPCHLCHNSPRAKYIFKLNKGEAGKMCIFNR